MNALLQSLHEVFSLFIVSVVGEKIRKHFFIKKNFDKISLPTCACNNCKRFLVIVRIDCVVGNFCLKRRSVVQEGSNENNEKWKI